MSEALELSLRTDFDEKETQLLMEKLWDTLGVLAQKYTGGQSSSLPTQTAQQLLASLWYTLQTAAEGSGRSVRCLLTEALWPMVEQGRALLTRRRERAVRYYGAVCRSEVGIRNAFYTDTIQGLGVYLRRYDVRYFAHRQPEDIDYPLLCTPSEALPGISYAESYLCQLLTENLLLRHFDIGEVTALLRATTPDVHGYRINLCEAPLTNALARSLLGRPGTALRLTAEDGRALVRLLRNRPATEVDALLERAGDALVQTLGQTGTLSVKTLQTLRADLLPRLMPAVEAGDVSAVFPAF